MLGDDLKAIELRHVQGHAHIPEALGPLLRRDGGGRCQRDRTEVDEMAIRRWFEKQLITRDRLPMQTLAGPETRQAHPMAILDALQEARPIRSDTQGDSTRVELSQDTLISAVLDDNRKWLRGRLQPWQLAACAWAEDRQRARPLPSTT